MFPQSGKLHAFGFGMTPVAFASLGADTTGKEQGVEKLNVNSNKKVLQQYNVCGDKVWSEVHEGIFTG